MVLHCMLSLPVPTIMVVHCTLSDICCYHCAPQHTVITRSQYHFPLPRSWCPTVHSRRYLLPLSRCSTAHYHNPPHYHSASMHTITARNHYHRASLYTTITCYHYHGAPSHTINTCRQYHSAPLHTSIIPCYYQFRNLISQILDYFILAKPLTMITVANTFLAQAFLLI